MRRRLLAALVVAFTGAGAGSCKDAESLAQPPPDLPAIAPEAADANPPAPQIPVVTDMPPPVPPPDFSTGDGGVFEGAIDFKLTGARGAGAPRYMVSGERAALLLVGQKTTRYVLLPAEKRVAVLFDTFKLFDTRVMISTHPFMHRNEGIDRVAGAACQIWEFDQDKFHFVACVARGLGRYYIDLFPSAAAWSAALADTSYFALRAVMFDAAGAEVERLEATKISRQKVPEATLTIPKTYRPSSNPTTP